MEVKLTVQEVLNLYLVANGLKPATEVSMRTFRCEEYEVDEERVEFEKYLDSWGVVYNKKEHSWRDIDENDKSVVVSSLDYDIGKNQECLDRLVNAETPEEKGRAYGYPEEAVQAFGKVVDGVMRDGAYVKVCMAQAEQAGVEIPTWIAYLSYVPEQLDLVNGNVSESSKALGEKHQSFVRENEPNLAKMVEEELLFDELPPTGWKLGEDGSYKLSWNNVAEQDGKVTC